MKIQSISVNSSSKEIALCSTLRRGSRGKCWALLLWIDGRMGMVQICAWGGSGWVLGKISVIWEWSNTGTGFLQRWLMLHVYQCSRDNWKQPQWHASIFGQPWRDAAVKPEGGPFQLNYYFSYFHVNVINFSHSCKQ